MKRLRTVVVTTAGFAVAMLALAGAASAHVTVTAPGATQGGGDQEITFRVPVEKDAETVGLKLQLPTDTPIASVDVLPVDGWTWAETTAKLSTPIHTDDGDITDAVTQIDWTAKAGQGLRPGEFGAFTIIAGQLPSVPSITFKAIQQYSDGSSVKWTQTQAPGSDADLENPAPVLQLLPAADSGDGGAASSPGAAGGAAGITSAAPGPATSGASSSAAIAVNDGAAPAAEQPAATSTSNTGPVVISIIALVLAVAALGLVIVGRARARAAVGHSDADRDDTAGGTGAGA